jgi:hypothetical protein
MISSPGERLKPDMKGLNLIVYPPDVLEAEAGNVGHARDPRHLGLLLI